MGVLPLKDRGISIIYDKIPIVIKEVTHQANVPYYCHYLKFQK